MPTQLTSALDLTAMPTTDNLAIEGWSWDNAINTLIIAGLDIDSSTGNGIILPADSTIIALDNTANTINTANNTNTTGVFSSGNLTIKGQTKEATATINIAAGDATNSSYGIRAAGNITIGTIGDGASNPTINASGKASGSGVAYGLAAESGGSITLLSGTTIASANVDSGGSGYAFYATNIIVLGADMVITDPIDAGLSTLTVDENRVVRENQGAGAIATHSTITKNTSGKITFTMSKNGILGEAPGGEFEFGLFDESDALIATTTNDADGLVIFTNVEFDTAGDFNYTIKELSGPSGWILDSKVYSVNITVEASSSGSLNIVVSYPDGAPNFKNVRQSDICGLVQFPEMTFEEPGSYQFTLRELTPSGGGWRTDNTEYPIIINVVDDGHGNLVATAEYPEGFPGFVNEYVVTPAKYVISACKRAIGAPLPEGRFQFGLFDSEGNLVATATNTAANPSTDTVVDNGLIPSFIRPVTGGLAHLTIDTPQFTGAITWDPAVTGGKFVVDETYTASIALTAKHGYTLSGVDPSILSIGVVGATLSFDGATSTLSVAFPATTSAEVAVNDGNITSMIAPAAGATGLTSIDEEQFTGVITWNPTLADSGFVVGQTYVASIVLTAKPGYSLDGVDPATFTTSVTGATTGYNAATQTLTIQFPATPGPSSDTAITDVTLPRDLQPWTDKSVTTSFADSKGQFDATVSWSPAVAGSFTPGQIYTATLTITPRTGYTLTGTQASDFSIDAWRSSIGSLAGDTLTIEFSAPAEPYYQWAVYNQVPASPSAIPNDFTLVFTGWTGWSSDKTVTIPMDASYNPVDYELWANNPGVVGTGVRPIFTQADATQVIFDTGTAAPGTISEWNWDGTGVVVNGSTANQIIRMRFLKRGS